MQTSHPVQNNYQPIKGFNQNFLKIFATLTMLIDLIAITVIFGKMLNLPDGAANWKLLFDSETTVEQLKALPEEFLNLYSVYTVMRLVGRIAFPIIVFLLYQGFCHTSNVKVYLIRIAACALAAEIPYNLVTSRLNNTSASVFYPAIQNPVCSLLLSLGMLLLMKLCETKKDTPKAVIKQLLLQFLCVIVACLGATFLRFEYAYIGPLLAAVFYFSKNSKKLQVILGCIVCLFYNPASLLAFVPIAMYNNTIMRSKKFQYFFYLLYPALLLILYGISLLKL